nr:carbohydrate-binding protein [Pseudomonadota bacterium]
MKTSLAVRRLQTCRPIASGLLMSLLMAAAASAATVHVEAENAALSGGTVVANDHTGYTGTGFVGGYTDGNKGVAQTSFAVNAATAGNYDLKLRYANGTGSAKTLTLYVDGVAKTQVSFGATASWNDWVVQATTVALSAGNHTVAYVFTAADSGNVNVDALDMDAVVATAGHVEAENGTLSGGAVVATDHTGYTGTGFVGGFTDANKGNAQAAFSVSAAQAGNYSLTMRYANGTGSVHSLTILVDGVSAGSAGFPATAGWDTWGTQVSTLTLAAGTHTIAYKYTTADTGNINLDALDVAFTGSGGSGGGGGTSAGAGEAETWFMASGATVSTSTSGYNGTGYVNGFSGSGARAIRNVFMNADGSATATIRYFNANGAARSLDVWINAGRAGSISLPATSGWANFTVPLPLRMGQNTVGLVSASAGADVGIDSMVLA